MAASTQEESNEESATSRDAADDGVADDAPEASARSASTAADAGSAGGTTVSIAVYRSSFPIVDWDLNDDDASLTKAEWAWEGDLPERGTPGAAIEWEAPSGYAEPTRAGFEFAGWSTDASAPAGGYLDGSGPALAMPEGAPEAGEYRLFALWTPIEYSVVFDLSKNPGLGDGPLDQELLDLAWESDQQAGRTVTPLGQGRYRVDGFTMEEDGYDPATRTVKLPVPTRGGYWHVGWAEPDGQSIAIDSKDGWALNPVRLTQVDGTPVLAARWATGFGVTAPISVTFGDYDKTGSPENPSQGSSGSSAADDTTQSEADDTATPGLSDQERYEAAGQAYFENTSWHDAVKMVALESERDANANQVLTTYDSGKASEAAVLGDGTPENPGERLLSLYPSATPGDASTGVHFRLDDALSEADLASFSTLGERNTPSARLDVSYGLNLSTDPVTGEPNHGLVLDTDDYDRKPIARVSYAFAVADAVTQAPLPHDFWTLGDAGQVVGLGRIKADAEAIAAGDADAIARYTAWMEADHRFYLRWYDKGVAEADAGSAEDSSVYEVRIIGINHDDLADGSGKAGLTFQLVNCLKDAYRMNKASSATGCWGASELRARMNPGITSVSSGSDDDAIWKQAPVGFATAVEEVRKTYWNAATATGTSTGQSTDKLFLAAEIEMRRMSTYANFNSYYNGTSTREGTIYAWYDSVVPDGYVACAAMVKSLADSTSSIRWFTRSRSPNPGNWTNTFLNIGADGSSSHALEVTSAAGVSFCFCL